MQGSDLFNPLNLTQEQHEAERLEATRAALQRERAGYEANGNADGVAAVDAELKRLGAGRKASPRSETAVRKAPETPGGGRP